MTRQSVTLNSSDRSRGSSSSSRGKQEEQEKEEEIQQSMRRKDEAAASPCKITCREQLNERANCSSYCIKSLHEVIA